MWEIHWYYILSGEMRLSCLQLKLKDADTNQLFVFAHNKLIECTPDNPTGVVELPAVRPDLAPLQGNTAKDFCMMHLINKL